MRVEHNDDGTIDVFLRQSWLNDWRDCNEKGRHLVNQPELSIGSDAAAIGTAVHAAAAAWCADGVQSADELVEIATVAWDLEITKPMKWVSYAPDAARIEVIELTRAWHRHMRPLVDAPMFIEHNFCVQLDSWRINDTEVRVWIKGTIDLVQAHSLVDWKTSKRKFSWRDKQSDSVQASVYAAAAVAEGWLDFPVRFTFGVLQRGSYDAQIVTVTRTPSHIEWLKTQIRPAINMAVRIGFEERWPMTDTGALCSDVWCPYWSSCKGKFLAPIHYPRKAS